MKRLFAALLTAALLLAGCAPAGEGLSSAPAETAFSSASSHAGNDGNPATVKMTSARRFPRRQR